MEVQYSKQSGSLASKLRCYDNLVVSGGFNSFQVVSARFGWFRLVWALFNFYKLRGKNRFWVKKYANKPFRTIFRVKGNNETKMKHTIKNLAKKLRKTRNPLNTHRMDRTTIINVIAALTIQTRWEMIRYLLKWVIYQDEDICLRLSNFCLRCVTDNLWFLSFVTS